MRHIQCNGLIIEYILWNWPLIWYKWHIKVIVVLSVKSKDRKCLFRTLNILTFDDFHDFVEWLYEVICQ